MLVAMGFYGVVLPALVATVCYLVASRSLRAGGAAWIVPVALASAYVAGYVGILGKPPFPPREATHWTFWIAIAAAVFAGLEAWTGWSSAVRWSLRALLVVASLGALRAPLPVHAGLAFAVLAAWFLFERALADRSDPPWVAWSCVVVLVSGAALTLASSGSLSLGQLAGTLAAAAGATLLVSLYLGGPSFTASSVPVPAAISSVLVLIGLLHSSLPRSSAVLLAAAPLATWLGRRGLVRVLLLLLPVAAAVLAAWLASPSYEY